MADEKKKGEAQTEFSFDSAERIAKAGNNVEQNIHIPKADSLRTVQEEVAEIERTVDLFNKVKTISIRLTKPTDWMFHGETPYLMDKGAENLAIAWGIDISDVKLTREIEHDSNGAYINFTASGKAYSKRLGRYVEEIGSCSQRDEFFGKIGDRIRPIDEIDINDLKKGAITNLYNRASKRICAMANMTAEDLSAAGLDVAKIGKVEYRKGVRKADAALLDAESLEIREAVWKLCLSLAYGKTDGALTFLKQESSFKASDGKDVFADRIESLSTPKWIRMTFKRLKAFHKKAFPNDPLPVKDFFPDNGAPAADDSKKPAEAPAKGGKK